MIEPAVVAIDGPAGAGKSTLSRRVAARLGFVYIDTGAMYRCVALAAVRAGSDLSDVAQMESLARQIRIEFGPGPTVLLNGEDVTEAIRSPQASQAASKISALPGVRQAMVVEQRRIAIGHPVVMEGRDIGTVVFPTAAVKIFLDADPLVRAERRAAEMRQKGLQADVQEIARQIAERDERDRTREDSPMIAASDAVHLDTSQLTLEQVEQAILDVASAKLRREVSS
jgi:cytidylate kinase